MAMPLRVLVFLAGLGAGQLALAAGVTVDNAWIRLPVAGQSVAGAYMTLQSPVDAALVGVSSPVAAQAEVHQMGIDSGGVMHMQPLARLALPAGKPVRLAPGGYHIMLEQLRQPLHAGEKVPLELRVETADHQIEQVSVIADVLGFGSQPAAPVHPGMPGGIGGMSNLH